MHSAKYKVFLIIIICFLFFLNADLFAQVGVYIKDTTHDLVGQRLVYKIKEYVRESNGLELSTLEDDSVINLVILTLDPGESSYKTIYSIVWTIRFGEEPKNIYYTHKVGTCGSRRVNEVAEGLVADTDVIAQDLKELYAYLIDEYYKDYTGEKPVKNTSNKLGINVETCSPEQANKYNLKSTGGVIINSIEYDSPAYDSELNKGDIILEIQDKKIYDKNDFERAVQYSFNKGESSFLLYVYSLDSNYKYIVLNVK